MKKTVLLLTAFLFTIGAANAAEPLLLEPLHTTVLSSSPANYDTTTIVPAMEKSAIGGGIYEAKYTPEVEYNNGMVPQNAAAKGEPVPVRTEPRVRIITKQMSQGNSYWNPGGKGTKTNY